eukprot:s667_g13.t2
MGQAGRWVSPFAQQLQHSMPGAEPAMAHQCRFCPEEFASKNRLFSHLRQVHFLPEAEREAPPPARAERRRQNEGYIVPDRKGDPIRATGPLSQLPTSILEVFNRWALQEPPIFRVPSRVLVEAVGWEDVKLAWQRGLLKEDQERWLQMLGKPEEQDILLSPLQPELNPDLLVAILKALKSATTHELFRFARGTWNHQANAQKWKACAEQTLGRVQVRLNKDKCHVSLRGDVAEKVDLFSQEDLAFSFLQRVDGQIFQCLGSIAESMYYYGPSGEPCPVDKPMCYKLTEAAIQAGHIRNLSNPKVGESAKSGRDSRLVVKLQPDESMLRVIGDDRSGACDGAQGGPVPNGQRFRLVPLEKIEPTAGSVQAAKSQQSYGGAFARGICIRWMTGPCHWGAECKYIHLHEAPKNGCPLSDGLQDSCAISDAKLRDVFWRNMKNGQLRTPLMELLDSLREEHGVGNDDSEMLQMLQTEILKENLVLLVAASSAKKADEWGRKVLQKLAASIDESDVCVLVSPVLTKPPASLMECLMAHCKQELLRPSFLHLRKVCLSCFALRITSQGFTKLAKYVGYFIIRSDLKRRSGWTVGCHGVKFQQRWAPSNNISSNIAQRKEDLAKFVGTSFSLWPSVGVLLESARLFGPDSLRPNAEHRSRLAALLCLLQDIEGKAEELSSNSDEDVDDEMEFESTSSSDNFQMMDPWPIPDDVEHHAWPLHIDDYSVEDSLTWICRHARQRLGPLQGKRVIRLTPGQYILSVFVNKLVYGLEPNAAGSLDPARVETLLGALQSIGAGSPSLPHQASYDLILATLVAYFRRHLLSTPAPSCPSSQEILASLFTAKALGRGQGRRHSLRNSILGLLRRHPKLRGRISSVCRGGSVAMALDTASSDHDIILCLKDGGANMVEELHSVILDTQKTCHRERLQRAEVIKKDFAVEIRNYYRKLLHLLDVEERRLVQMADDSCVAWKKTVEETVKRMHRKLWDLKIGMAPEGFVGLPAGPSGPMRVSLDDLPKSKQPGEPNEAYHSAYSPPLISPISPISPLSSGPVSEWSSASSEVSEVSGRSFPRQTTAESPRKVPARALQDDPPDPLQIRDALKQHDDDANQSDDEENAMQPKKSAGKKMDKFLTRTTRTEQEPDAEQLWKMKVQTWMDYIAGFLVMFNSLVMMMELEFEGRAAGVLVGHTSHLDIHTLEDLFLTLDRVFVFLFFAEWSVRLYVEKKSFFLDVANLFDTFLVFAGLVDFVITIVMATESGASRSIVVLRLMRALKSLRAIRMVRSLRFFQGLRVLVKACQCFLPSLCWAMVLLGIFMSMGALLLGNMLQEFVIDDTFNREDREWIWRRYGTTAQAMYTLFEITFAGNWPTSARPVLEKVSPYFVLFFVPYICIVVFAIIRVIGAVFLKDTLDAAQNDAEQLVIDRLRLKEQYVNKLEGIFRAIDETGNGLISEERLSSILSNPKVAAYFQTLDLDVHESAALFHILDNGDGEVTLDEFIDGIMRCKGPARAIDQVAMHAELKQLDAKVTKLFRKLLKVSKASHFEIKTRNASKQVTAMKAFRGEVGLGGKMGLGSPGRDFSKSMGSMTFPRGRNSYKASQEDGQ